MFFTKKRSILSWLGLSLFIRVMPPRILYYLNQIVPKSLRTGPDKRDNVPKSIFEQAIPFKPDQTLSMEASPIPKPNFFTSEYLRSPEGIIAFKKLKNSPVLPEYLECQLEGLAYFDKVFRDVGGHQSTHGDIMVEHHRILATGFDGLRNYRIGFSKENSKNVAGKLRYAEGRVAFPARETKSVKTILRALTEIERYPEGQWDIEIDGIPVEAWSTGMRVKQGFDIVHPDGKFIPLYFSRMGECLNLIRYPCYKSGPRGHRRRNFMLQALATYFHLGIHSHAFLRINQSLLWAQTNYILMLNGFRPVHHGYVDIVAAFLDTGHFCNYFTSYISKHSFRTGI
jgi:hypothetical protein